MTDGEFQVEDVDFEAIYQGISPMGDNIPWITGRPQPAVVALARSGQIGGDVLDIGCGTGDNAIFLALRGYQVTAIDGSATAIERAKERAWNAGTEVEFAVADALKLDGFDGRFDTIIDSALYHCFDEEQRHLYVAALHRVARPGARLHLLCFSEDLPAAFPAPFRISERNLRVTIGPKWTISKLVPARYETTLVDDESKLLLPMWQLAARRID